jgi:NADPH:quinone reductase-like Zn-dependent oxidoreductase
MRVLRMRRGGGLDNLRLEDTPDPGAPGPGQIRVRIEASSLNFHDLGVVSGRRPMPRGASRCPTGQGASRR